MPAVSRRQEIIEVLLDHLPDYEPAQTRGGIGGWGEGTPRMPEIYWEPAVQELYRCLRALRAEPTLELDKGRGPVTGSSIYSHLTAFYHSEWRTVRPNPKKRVLRGRVEWVEQAPSTWRRERIVSPWVIADLVKRGVLYIVLVYQGEPFLPDQILKAA